MPKTDLHRPGIEPGPPALQAGTLPKALSTLYEKLTENSAVFFFVRSYVTVAPPPPNSMHPCIPDYTCSGGGGGEEEP